MEDDERARLDRAITSALRDAIHEHGPITPDRIGSAVKRILGNLKNAGVSLAAAGAALVRHRWAGTTKEERRAATAGIVSKGGRAAWAGMSAEARSEEMKRRAALRKKRKRTAAGKDEGR